MSFLGPLVHLFWISGDVSSGFQSQSGFCLTGFYAEANVMYIPWDPPLVLHLPKSWQPITAPHACAEVGPGLDLRIHQGALFRICQGSHLRIHEGAHYRIHEGAHYRIHQGADQERIQSVSKALIADRLVRCAISPLLLVIHLNKIIFGIHCPNFFGKATKPNAVYL